MEVPTAILRHDEKNSFDLIYTFVSPRSAVLVTPYIARLVVGL
jgi:hypothetical protein